MNGDFSLVEIRWVKVSRISNFYSFIDELWGENFQISPLGLTSSMTGSVTSNTRLGMDDNNVVMSFSFSTFFQIIGGLNLLI